MFAVGLWEGKEVNQRRYWVRLIRLDPDCTDHPVVVAVVLRVIKSLIDSTADRQR